MDNGGGNPYHDKEGKFTSKEGADITDKSESSPVASKFSKVSLLDFINKKKQAKQDKIKEENGQALAEFVEKSAKIVSPEEADALKSQYSFLSVDEKKSLLSKSPYGYDKEKLAALDDAGAEALMYAESMASMQMNLKQSYLELEKERDEINAQANEEVEKMGGSQAAVGIWLYPTTVSQYKEKLDSGSIQAKKEYYQNIMSDDYSEPEKKEKAAKMMNKLDLYIKAGEEYEAKKAEALAQNAGKLLELDEKIAKAKSEYDSSYQKWGEAKSIAEGFISKFQDQNAPYSKMRKDSAIWITGEWSEREGFKGLTSQEISVKLFGKRMDDIWKNDLSPSERESLKLYTGSYSKFNEPLRSIKYTGSKSHDFVSVVNNMTSAIDKCVWNEDIWVQRGVSTGMTFKSSVGSKVKKSLTNMTDGELQGLVGTSFKDNGFYSSGAAKGTGFKDQPIILNTYCPKGTKMAYMNTQGQFAYSKENEMILQRGYSYRITKVEKKGYKYYIDCEVILGSDADKPIGDELVEIKNKYIGD